jgi:hypothetical protein
MNTAITDERTNPVNTKTPDAQQETSRRFTRIWASAIYTVKSFYPQSSEYSYSNDLNEDMRIASNTINKANLEALAEWQAISETL